MGWVLVSQEEPELAVRKTKVISWNEATHRMMRYPVRVDLLYNAEGNAFGLCGGGQYLVSVDDDNVFSIKCEAALAEMGLDDLEAIYRVTPQAFEPEEEPDPAQPYLDGGIWAPLPE